jgi:quinol monooxygenase YgiN
MATMLITHKVKNFSDWKKVFDSAFEMRKSSGELSAQVYQDAGDPNMVTTVNKWNSMANAQKFAQSPDLKAAMEKAGVEGHPSVYFLNEV